MKKSCKNIFAGCSLAALVFSVDAFAQDGADLLDLPLEKLMNIEVTSVSKRPEKLMNAAAAIHVITQEDIRRSGATSLPEVLRLAPGLNVARTSANQWSISARGFNAGFANKLLVLKDGRTIYTPLFSGVYWDTQDIVMEDIKQIEIIRGPGATLWGANAVNGIINIITKDASETQGELVSAVVGNKDRAIVAGRAGGKKDNANYRTYVKHSRRASEDTITKMQGNDSWHNSSAGFRLDEQSSPQSKLTVIGDVYAGEEDQDLTLPAIPSGQRTLDELNFSGANVLAKIERKLDDGSNIKLQTYYDRTVRNYDLLDQTINTLDAEMQHTINVGDRQEFVWGGGYRLVFDELDGSSRISFTSSERYTQLYNAFVQDTIALQPEKFFLTVGSKIEHNDFTGVEFQPSAKLAYHIDDSQTLWGAVSRAVRTPSRAEDDIQLIVGTVPPGVFIRQQGDSAFESEDVIAYELGYRSKPTTDISIDVATFYNDYTNLRSAEVGAPVLEPGGFFVPVSPDNKGKGEAYGVEIGSTWDVRSDWKLSANYTFLVLTLHTDSSSTDTELAKDERRSPKNQFNIRSLYNITPEIEWDNTVYYVDNILGVPAYVRADSRVGWKMNQDVSFDLVGQNLFDDVHPEFSPLLHSTQASQIGRSVYGKVTVNF